MRRLTLLGVLLIFVRSALGGDYGFRVESAELRRQGTELLLDADIDYRFSAAAIEALENGVPLTVDVRLKLERRREMLWNKTLVDVRLPYRIRYHALAKLYQVISVGSGVQRNFASLQSALAALGAIRGVPVAEAERIDAGGRHEAALQVRLDREALPLPLRPISYVTPQWYLSSSWYRWPLEK